MNSPAPSSDAPKPSDSYVQSFARGLAVIRSFGASAPSQTLSEVAARTGLTRAGARRILLTLEGLGYVSSEGRQFRLTARTLDLGFAYLSSLPLWHLAEPVMEGLAAEVRESCSAAVLDGSDIVYVLRVPTHRIMSITLGIGSRLPAYCTSMGRVLLAGLPPAEARVRLLAAPRRAMTARTTTDIDALMAEIARVRDQGWCLVDQELEEGLVSLAAPISDRSERVIAALNLSAQVVTTPPAQMLQRCLPPLRAAAARISSTLRMKA
jgi:IclR family transcriptional regulator, pca regulon regulatory protein